MIVMNYSQATVGNITEFLYFSPHFSQIATRQLDYAYQIQKVLP